MGVHIVDFWLFNQPTLLLLAVPLAVIPPREQSASAPSAGYDTRYLRTNHGAVGDWEGANGAVQRC